MARVLVDKYEVVGIIGRGGMGTVYEAREIGSGRKVAIKWMHERAFAPDDPNLLRFQQEARIAGALDSPHVTAVYECAREPEKDVVFLVMELLEGEDLRAVLDRVGALEPVAALCIATQACAGLAAAHAAGVVHRDIKPENLFLAKNGDGTITVKLLDFGVAKIRRSKDGSSAGATSTHAMTATGDVLGTPLYMAPEQFEGAKHVDARADVYSMGATLYALLAGAPPHANLKSFMQIWRAITTQPLPPLRERAPWVHPAIASVVEKAMSLGPADRYSNASSMFAALAALLPPSTVLKEDMLVGPTDEQKNTPAALGEAKTIAAASVASARTESSSNSQLPWWKKLIGR